MTTPAQIKDWRVAQGLTREQAAARLGVSMATFIRWETGKGKPSTLAGVAALRRELGAATTKGE